MTRPRRNDPELGKERWCTRCQEWWPIDAEFWYAEPKRPNALHCRACKADRDRHRKFALCTLCLTVRTQRGECHGCSRRLAGTLTVARLASWGMA